MKLAATIDANRADDEPWRIERLTLLLRILEYRWEPQGPTLPAPTSLYDHKGILTVGWNEVPSDEQLTLVEDMWNTVFCEHEIEHEVRKTAGAWKWTKAHF